MYIVSVLRKMNLDVSTLFRHNWSPTRDPIDVMKASLCYLGGAEVIITEIQGEIMEVIYWETNFNAFSVCLCLTIFKALKNLPTLY